MNNDQYSVFSDQVIRNSSYLRQSNRQLIVCNARRGLFDYPRFQFHFGTTDSQNQTHGMPEFTNVSIPLWYD